MAHRAHDARDTSIPPGATSAEAPARERADRASREGIDEVERARLSTNATRPAPGLWRRPVRGALLALITVSLFGLLGIAALAVALVGASHQRDYQRWPFRAALNLVMASCAIFLVVASLAPISAPSQAIGAQAPSPRLETMASLFTAIDEIPGSGPPWRIVRVGAWEDDTILVMIRGQETDHLLAALKPSIGLPGDPLADRVRAAIERYRSVNHLPPGVTVIFAGHSLGGIVAQEIAREPHASDFRVAAVVTWGAPDIGGHVAGVTYQEYFSQYDVVPMLSTYQLTPTLLGLGLAGTLGALAVMQTSPELKALFTGQTYVPDMGQYWNPADWAHTDGSSDDAHNGYGKSAWLDHQTLTYWRDGERQTLTLVW